MSDNIGWGVLLGSASENFSDNNTITANIINNTAAPLGDGILVGSPGGLGGRHNTIFSNQTSNNADVGIKLSAGSIGNFVRQNLALGNGVDLLDENFNCDLNTWKNNEFNTKTANPPDSDCIK